MCYVCSPLQLGESFFFMKHIGFIFVTWKSIMYRTNNAIPLLEKLIKTWTVDGRYWYARISLRRKRTTQRLREQAIIVTSLRVTLVYPGGLSVLKHSLSQDTGIFWRVFSFWIEDFIKKRLYIQIKTNNWGYSISLDRLSLTPVHIKKGSGLKIQAI